MKKNKSRAGVTLVEVMIAMFLVSVAAIIVYTEMLMAYRMLMRSRARLEAQSIAFDRMWTYYNNTKISKLPTMPGPVPEPGSGPTPEWSLLSTNGWVDMHIRRMDASSWDIVVTVWPPTNSLLQIGTNPLARTTITRWNTRDRKVLP